MVAQSRPASSEAIRQVRSFNRLVTERIGALEEGYLARG
ncbi:MAG: GNAT family N-acetyltransferase, partial [Dehalococcoidia bacterium]|nr:GNAT family N-acetyltransferase [Dehalococcoidia bacterium]